MAYPLSEERLHALDALRGFALLLGVAFHATLSFMPDWPVGLWAMADSSPSAFLRDTAFVAHIFRMTLFFFIAGYFARMLHARLGAVAFWRHRATRILIPMVVAWLLLVPVLHHIWLAGITKQLGGAVPSMPEVPKSAGAFPLMHLWFLYLLLIFYVCASTLSVLAAKLAAADKLGQGVLRLLVATLRTPVAPLVFGVPATIALINLPVWFYWSGVPTPDQTLIPQTAPTVAYGVAFFVGWSVHRVRDALAHIQARWVWHLAMGALATAWLLHILHAAPPMAAPGATTITFAYLFGVASWGWSLGLTGMSLRFLSAYSPVRRYVSDASYWIYLVHLPVVTGLQVWVGQWPLHWTVKFPLVLLTSFLILFASYHLLVRFTPVGRLLNGRQHRFRARGATALVDDRSSAHSGAASGTTVAELHGVSKAFGEVAALSEVSIVLREGEVHALLGPNGAGKSTAISMWLGLLTPDAGGVSILGGPPNDPTRRAGLGIMMQQIELPKELRVRELVRLASSYYGNPLPLSEVLDRAGVRAFADRKYGQLSGGQKRLTQYAVATCGAPRVLFLDEPSAGLDVQAREILWEDIRKLRAAGCSIVLTTHYLEEAEVLADRVTFIARGRVVVSGTIEQVSAFVGRRRIACETSVSSEVIRTWPGVSEVLRREDRTSIMSTAAEDVVRRLLAADPSLQRLEVLPVGLGDVFNELARGTA